MHRNLLKPLIVGGMLIGAVVALDAAVWSDAQSAQRDHPSQSQNETQRKHTNNQKGARQMDLGNFSVSLAVKDLAASRTFYEKLGFKQIHGQPEQNWIILQNGNATIGLFQGMFEENVLTFNPGWDREGKNVDPFTDVREIQKSLKKAGIPFISEADESSTGPASFIIADPDGNTILVDQHR